MEIGKKILNDFTVGAVSPGHASPGHISPGHVSPGHVSPGHAAVVTHPAVLLLVVATAGLADVHVTVQALTFAVDQELEWLQAADTEGVGQVTLGAKQILLCVLLLYLSLQLSATTTTEEN